MINQRIFSANVGDSSVGIAGPDAIEQDIDNLLANDQELLGTLNDHETQINSLDAEVDGHELRLVKLENNIEQIQQILMFYIQLKILILHL